MYSLYIRHGTARVGPLLATGLIFEQTWVMITLNIKALGLVVSNKDFFYFTLKKSSFSSFDRVMQWTGATLYLNNYQKGPFQA